MLNLMGVLNATAANVSCTCNCKRYTSLQSMEISEYNLNFKALFFFKVATRLNADCGVTRTVFWIN